MREPLDEGKLVAALDAWRASRDLAHELWEEKRPLQQRYDEAASNERIHEKQATEMLRGQPHDVYIQSGGQLFKVTSGGIYPLQVIQAPASK